MVWRRILWVVTWLVNSFENQASRCAWQETIKRRNFFQSLCRGRINNFYCLTKMISLSAAIGKQFNMFEKHFPSAISVGDFFGDDEIISGVRFDVSLFSLESISTSRLSSDDCDVDSSDDSASAIFSRSLLSQS